jgi:hypothetical protein
MKVVHRKKTDREIFRSRLRFALAEVHKCAYALSQDAANSRENWTTIEKAKTAISAHLEPLLKAGKINSYVVRTFDEDGDALEKNAHEVALIGGAMAKGSIMLFWWIDKEFVVKEQ